MTRPLQLLVSLLILAQPAISPAQEPSPLFFETVDVRVVNVEVLVTERDGTPVTDLTTEDFEILVDGDPVEITHFTIVDNGTRADRGAEPAPLPSPQNRSTELLRLVVFVDDLHLSPGNRTAGLRALREYLPSRLHPADRVMLVRLGSELEILQGFTADHQLLMAALDRIDKSSGHLMVIESEHRLFLGELQRLRLPPRLGSSSSMLDQTDFGFAVSEAVRLAGNMRVLAERRFERTKATLAVLRSLSTSLAGLPGRKAIIYLSDGLPLRPADSLMEAYRQRVQDWALRNAGRISPMRQILLPIRIPDESIVDALNGLAVYPMQMEMRGGPHKVSVGVHDRLSRLDSSVNILIAPGAGPGTPE